MLDIHAHVLPGLDHGCNNLDEALEGIKKAADCGITKIFATSHYFKGKVENYAEDIYREVESLNNVIDRLGIGVNVVSGCEIKVCPDIVELLLAGKLSSLNNSRYVLIEFPMDIKVPNVCSVIRDILAAGFVPIIAHPERYTYVMRNIDEAISYVESGALLQININSLIGDYGEDVKACSVKLLKHNLIHIWGTDHHSCRIGYDKDKLDKSFKVLEKIVGLYKFNIIKDFNPQCVYDDLDIEKFDIKYKVGLFS